MKSLWIERQSEYDGSQLACQFAYLNHGILGDSIVAWVGPCNVRKEHMADGEDLLQGAEIRGGLMLHFIIEVFDQTLLAGVALQRLFAGLFRDELGRLNPEFAGKIERDGDDLYWNQRKLSISVAAKSPLGVVIHFAANVINEGVPVPTCALKDFGVVPQELAAKVMTRFAREYSSIKEATYKVRPLR